MGGGAGGATGVGIGDGGEGLGGCTGCIPGLCTPALFIGINPVDDGVGATTWDITCPVVGPTCEMFPPYDGGIP